MSIDRNPYYLKAIDFIRNNDLNVLPVGKTIIDGDNLWVNIMDADLRTIEKAKFEAHNEYIDIQIPLSRNEKYGVKPRSECTKPIGVFNCDNDYILYDDLIEVVKDIKAGEMIVFDTKTSHAPLIGDGKIHKAIFKVRAIH